MTFKWILFFLLLERIQCQTGIFYPSTFTQSTCSGSYQWSIWFDTNDPTLSQGDFELTSHIQKLLPDYMCATPIAIEALTSFDTDPTKTGDVIRITLKEGFMCLNQQVTAYKTRLCTDYKVRYCCPV